MAPRGAETEGQLGQGGRVRRWADLLCNRIRGLSGLSRKESVMDRGGGAVKGQREQGVVDVLQ